MWGEGKAVPMELKPRKVKQSLNDSSGRKAQGNQILFILDFHTEWLPRVISLLQERGCCFETRSGRCGSLMEPGGSGE